MKKRNQILKILFLLLIGLGSFSMNVFAEKKATEGNNQADVEFYEPTPKKPGPIKPDPPKPEPPKPEPKKFSPVTKLLPKTGESNTVYQTSLLGIGVLFSLGYFVVKYKKVGDENEV